MSFLHQNYLIPALLVIAILVFLVRREYKAFFSWIETYWGFRPHIKSMLSLIFYYGGLSLLVFALLDLRGPEERVQEEVPKQKTLILLDTSASMLVEDVRPNRFGKSTLMARHFVKNAAGHDVSVALFSDVTKKLVPFTTDYDLLDARISALEKLDLTRGGSNISLAIESAIQDFVGEDGIESGNILVFSDSEETIDAYDLKVPESVSIAFVGVGTLNGGKIPLRSSSGRFIGHKRYNGEEVVSKLNENFLKNLSARIKNYQYWVAQSYSLPTDQILRFFQKAHDKRFDKSLVRTRPVYGTYMILIAILMVISSYLLRSGKNYRVAAQLVLLLSLFGHPLQAQVQKEEKEKKPALTNEEVLRKSKLENQFKKAEISVENKFRLAELYLKEGKGKKALTIYEENKKFIDENPIDRVNYGTSLILEKKLAMGIGQYQLAYSESRENKKITDVIRKNSLWALQARQNQDKNQDKKQDQNKDQKGDQDQKGNDQKEQQQKGDQQNKDKQEGSDSSQKEKEKKEQKDQQGQGDQEQKKKEQKGLGKEDQSQDEKKKNKEQQKKQQEQQQGQQKRRPPPGKRVKLPGILKQLLQKEKQIQEKMLDTRTNDNRGSRRKKKDW